MIALGAKMAKADGVVTEVEIRAFKQVFHMPDSDLPAVARVFNLAKQDSAGYEILCPPDRAAVRAGLGAAGGRARRPLPYRQG